MLELEKVIQEAMDEWRILNDPTATDGRTMAQHVAARLRELGMGKDQIDRLPGGRTATVTEAEHVLTTRQVGRNKDGFPVVAASCPCGWEHMTAHNPARYESERDAITYLAYRYNDAHKQGRDDHE